MADEETNVGKTVGAIADLAKAVPIYQDAIQPAAKELGKSLKVVAQAVSVALIPIEGMVWGVEKIKGFVRERVAEKLKNIPPEDVQQPKPQIAVPAVEALRYTGEEPELADLYANLLATSMDKVTAYRAHPGFVDIIKNMSPDEARILKFMVANGDQPLINIKLVVNKENHFRITHRHVSLIAIKAACQFPQLAANYLDNLVRLGIIEIPTGSYIINEPIYQEIENYPQVQQIKNSLVIPDGGRVEFDKSKIELTDFGKQFCRACVVDKEAQERS